MGRGDAPFLSLSTTVAISPPFIVWRRRYVWYITTFLRYGRNLFFMEYPFGHGFITSITLIAQHFALPPEQAWFGAGDHVEGLVLPEKFKGTDVEGITTLLRKKVIWHQPGTMDKEDARDVITTLQRLVIAIDRELGIPDASIGQFR